MSKTQKDKTMEVMEVQVKNIYLNPNTYPKVKLEVVKTKEVINVSIKKEIIDMKNPTTFGVKLVKAIESKETLKVTIRTKEHNGHINQWLNPYYDDSSMDIKAFLKAHA